MYRLSIAVISAFILVACSAPSVQPPFEHAVAGDVRPWKHENFDNDADKFTFAVFSDLTGGEREGVFEVAVEQLNLLRPELIVNVGDLIEGESIDRQEIDAQWDSFDARAGKARAPVFYVGGNHDLSGTFLQSVWDDRLGKRYYHFVYKNVLFLVLDTEDNTAERSQEIFELRNAAIDVARQKDGTHSRKPSTRIFRRMRQAISAMLRQRISKKVIAKNSDVRWTFLFMHKAAWERGADSGFVQIEQALRDQPYTVFHGHVHAYEHIERLGRDYIRLATTGGVQFLDKGRSMDHATLVTVDNDGVDIANLLLSGILDKTGHIPANGDQICFELVNCTDSKKD